VFWVAAFTMTGTTLAVFTLLLWWQHTSGLRRLIGSSLLQAVALLCGEHAAIAPLLLLAVSLFSATRERWRRIARDLSGSVIVAGLYIGLKLGYFLLIGPPQGPYAMRFDAAQWLAEIARYASVSINLASLLAVGQRQASILGGVLCAIAVASTVLALRGADRMRLLALGIDLFLIALLPVLPLTVHQYDYFVGVAALGAALAMAGLGTLVAGARAGAVLTAIVTVFILLADARGTDVAARDNQTFLLYRTASQNDAALLTNLDLVRHAAGSETQVLVPDDPVTRYTIEACGAGEVFFDPPLHIAIVPRDAMLHHEPLQAPLPYPTMAPQGSALPFWWQPPLDWIRLWVPLPRLWYRHAIGLP